MKQNKCISLISALTLGATLLQATPVFAVVADSKDTKGSIEFEADNSTIVAPTDPESPDKNLPDILFPGGVSPIDPDGTVDPGKVDPNGELPTDPDAPNVITPGPAASLWIGERPKEFNFGLHKISSADVAGNVAKTYEQEGVFKSKQAVVVYDGRLNYDEWDLTAELSAFDTGKLASAYLTIENLSQSSLKNQYTPTTVLGTDVKSGAIELQQGAVAELFKADANQKAKGSNSIVFDNVNDIKLHVAGKDLATGAHNATVTWTLNGTPKD